MMPRSESTLKPCYVVIMDTIYFKVNQDEDGNIENNAAYMLIGIDHDDCRDVFGM